MTYHNIFLTSAFILQLFVIFMWMRSGFYIYRIKNEISIYERWVYGSPIVLGAILSIYNLNDIDYILLRFPIKALLSITSAWAIYVYSRGKKENAWNIGYVLKERYSASEKAIFKKVKAEDKNDEVVVVTEKDLEVFQLNNEVRDKFRAILRVIPPPNTRFKFIADLMVNGKYGKQKHPNLHKFIHIDYGEIEETESGKKYKAGEIIDLPPKTVHGLKGLAHISKCSVYLYKVN